MSDRTVRVALVQQRAGGDRDDNRRRGLDALERAAAQGARIVGFAELAFEPFHPQEPARGDVSALAEPIPGPTTDLFAAAARRLGVAVVLNLFERADGRTFDASPVIDADGTLLGVTRMVHITDYACFHEQGYYAPGDRGAPVYATQHGRVGVAICYDRHYPEVHARARTRWGGDRVHPAGGCGGRVAGRTLRSRGAGGRVPQRLLRRPVQPRGPGVEANVHRGESFVCGPDGSVIARAARGTEEILVCDLDLNEIARSAARTLFLRDRRPELYGAWLARD